MRSEVYFLPPRTSVTDSVGISTLPILSCSPKAATRDSKDSLTLRSNPEYEWMMYHFIFGLRGASIAPSAGAACCGSLAVVVVWLFSSSCIVKTLLPGLRSSLPLGLSLVTGPEITEQGRHGMLNDVIDDAEVEGKDEYGNDDDHGRAANFFQARRRDLAGLGTHVVVERHDPLRPGFYPVSKAAARSYD